MVVCVFAISTPYQIGRNCIIIRLSYHYSFSQFFCLLEEYIITQDVKSGMAILTTAQLQEPGIRKGRRLPLTRGLGYPQIPFIYK